MRKWLIITLSAVAFFLLSGRLIIRGFQKNDAEKKWYLEQLEFEFSAQVDTVLLHTKYHGLVLFHVTEGDVNREMEDRLNEQLVHHAGLRLLTFKSNDQVEFFSKMAYQYRRGDSLRVNTGKDQLLIFRKNKKIYERGVMELLVGDGLFE